MARSNQATFRYLENLWIRAGGNPHDARIMAAIAMAESGGRAVKQQGQPPGKTGWGFWQITPGDPSLLDPLRNAQEAVRKFREQGLSAWTTYTSGAYKQFLGLGRGAPTYVSPVAHDAKFARVDQGVDYQQARPYVAMGDGVVYALGRGFKGGTGQAVYIKLDHPITVNGRTYDEIYYAETTPMVKVGQHVKAGQAVASGGAAELGFAQGASPMAPLVGGYGAGTQASVQGHDFLDVVQKNPNVQISVGTAPPIETATASHHENRAQGFGIGYQDLPPSMDGQFSAPQQSTTQEGAFGINMDPLNMPLSPIQSFDIWQQLAQNPNASPETQALAANSHQIHSQTPAVLMPSGITL